MYRIGFDAKRLFHNGTGLGNYSRSLVSSLSTYHPNHDYVLFSPSISYSEESFYFTEKYKVITPSGFSKIGWRSRFILNDLIQQNIDIYHGLSHELPFGIENTGVKSVVTIHDLIYKFFPEDFPLLDKKIYEMKWRNACKNADAIIAISEATKQDIMHYFGIPEQKIHVVYQTCSSIYDQNISDSEKQQVQLKFKLPNSFLLYVGAISERKNVLSLVKAYNQIKNDIKIPLVLVGNGRGHLQKVKDYVVENNLQSQVIFLSNVENNDLPALYQLAKIFLYPSKYEGFGIPIVEALKSRTPVITSNISSLPEVAGNAGIYIDPLKPESISEAILNLCRNEQYYSEMVEKGNIQAQLFTLKSFADNTMSVYKSII